jgi:hypothetical protein
MVFIFSMPYFSIMLSNAAKQVLISPTNSFALNVSEVCVNSLKSVIGQICLFVDKANHLQDREYPVSTPALIRHYELRGLPIFRTLLIGICDLQ